MVLPTDQFSAIYDKAVQKYYEITGEKLAVDVIGKIRSVGDLTNAIDEGNSTFREFRERRGAIFDVLETALIPVQLFGDLAAGGAAMVFPPSSLVFGAVMHLVGAAKGVSASYDAIQDLMQMLQDFTVRLGVYTQEAVSEALSDKLSDIILTLIEILALSSNTIRRGRLLKFTRNILLGNNDAIQAAMVRLDKLTGVEANLVGAETLTELKRAGRVVDGISVTVNATNATILETGMTVNQVSAQVHGVQEMLEELIVTAKEEKQLFHGDPAALQSFVSQVVQPSKFDSAQEWFQKINKARVAGTGDWLYGEHVFQSWVNKETPVIFLSGNPGTGKSFLVTNMISFLLERFGTGPQRDPLVSVGFYFFKGDNPQTRSFHQALRDLAFQLSKSDAEYQKYLATIEGYEQISTLESAWRLLFVEYFLKKRDTKSTTYILLDAVDEALDEERRVFIDLARELYDNQSCLQLAIVGRPYISDQLLEGLGVKVPTLHVTKQKNSSDITQYIHVSIRKSLVLRRVSAKLRNEIIDKLSARAEGMFLWVNLMIQELVRKRNEASMRKALEQAPRGLNEMLRHVLATFSQSSNEEELEFLNETLLWVTCDDRHWKLSEIEAILRLKSPEGDGMIDLEGALRRQWASFFTLHREDGLTTADLENGPAHLDAFDWLDDEEKENEYESTEEDYFTTFNSKPNTTTVTFCHASIGDFLRNESEGKVSATGGHMAAGVNYHEARPHILKTYLSLITDPKLTTKANDSGHMLEHAARNWGNHLLSTLPSECPLDDRLEIAKMLLKAFRSEVSMSSWLGEDIRVIRRATLEAVRPWWEMQEVHEVLSLEEKEFLSTMEDHPSNLFKPIAMFSLKRWLLEDVARPDSMVSMVWRYQMLAKGEEFNDEERFITAEEIVEAAEFGGFAKTSRWFRQCAVALRQSGYHEEALEYFNRAMEIDPDDWRTMRELAETYQDQDDWETSIKFWERTRLRLLTIGKESSEDTLLKGHLHECLECMARIYQGQENWQKQFEVVQEAYLYAPSCWTCITTLLALHNDHHDYKATMDVLKKLADTPAPEDDCSELTQFLLDNVFDVEYKSGLAADAALATNDLDFVLESLQTAARVARTASRTLIAVEVDMAIARIYNDFLLDHQRAIRCWEKVIDTYSSSSHGTIIGMIRFLASKNLAQTLLCNAIEVGIDTPESVESLAKLEELVNRSQHDDPSGSYAFMPAVYLGIFYRLRGQEDRARALFQLSLQRCVFNFSGDCPATSELTDLQYILMRAGDMKNVVAMAHRADEENRYPSYRCRGSCRRQVSTRDGFSICPICLQGEWCPDCFKSKEVVISQKRCHSQHMEYWISVPPLPKDISSGVMLVEGKELEFETWLNQLKKEWALDAPSLPVSTADQFSFADFSLGFMA